MPQLPIRLTRTREQLHLPAPRLTEMLCEGWRTWPHETGGILLGIDHGTYLQVTATIGPGPGAEHARYTFTPDSDWQASQVAAAWRRDRNIEYLGDWHTHPGGTTRFSRLDTETARVIANAPQARQPAPVMVVLALSADAITRTGAARLEGHRLVPMALRVTRPDEL